jgi:hypothetical protein
METIKTTDAFKKNLVALDRDIAMAQDRFNLCLKTAIDLLGVPQGYELNKKTLDFEPKEDLA